MPRVHRHAMAAVRNGLIRPGADPTYADGDDATWMQVDWGAYTRRLSVDGQRVHAIDTGGDGPPLLFIHGLGGVWQNWLLNITAFMGSHRCVALDLPGFGQSEMPGGSVSIQGYARVVDAVCGQLGIDCPVVIGNSMGGFVGAELALSYPTRVKMLVLVSAAGLSTEYLRREPVLALARVWSAGVTRAGVLTDPVVRRRRLRRMFLQTVARYPERLSIPLTYELVQGAGRQGFVPSLQALMEYSFRDRLAQIEIPVLIVWGRNDMIVPVGDAERFERLIGPNAKAVIFEDTGHVPMLERPGRFNELLEAFIAGEREPQRGVEGVSA
jgi:pimeloyl-ACP methyl ester carboxylesterase